MPYPFTPDCVAPACTVPGADYSRNTPGASGGQAPAYTAETVTPPPPTSPPPSKPSRLWLWLLGAGTALYLATASPEKGLGDPDDEDEGDDAPTELNGPRRKRRVLVKKHKAAPRHVAQLTIS